MTKALETADIATLATTTLTLIARRMQIPKVQVAEALAKTSWTAIEVMIDSEFAGPYWRYYPKCDMAIRDEAVVAEAFDLLAIAFEDPRRALRCGAWGPPTAPASRLSRARQQARSLLNHWYAMGPEDVPFHPGHPEFNVHRIVEDDPDLPHVVVQNGGGQRFELEREFARTIALAPIRF